MPKPWARTGNSSSRFRVQAHMRLTPSAPDLFSVFSLAAVSVVVVLITIEAGSTPMGCSGRAVLLPQTLNPPLAPESPNDLAISLEKDGTTFIDTKWFPPDGLRVKLRELAARNPGKRVVLKADRRLPFRAVRTVLGTISAAGYPDVLLAAGTPNPLGAAADLMWRRTEARDGTHQEALIPSPSSTGSPWSR